MNQPRGREKHVTDHSLGVQKRGSGLGTGPVGNRGGSSSGGSTRAGTGRRMSPLGIIIGLIVALAGGGGGLSLLGGSGSSGSSPIAAAPSVSVQQPASAAGNSALFSNLMSGSGTGSGWNAQEYTGKLDTTVASGSRPKYTSVKGGGSDTTTIMVYMCGTDLESKGGMASSDLREMAAASFDDRINLIIYTGGCAEWKLSGISSRTNQIYQIKDGNMYRLVEDAGAKSMTSPDTLSEFIRFCTKNYPANRNDLILWDHGGGSISGYGYDQKFQSSGSMNLSGISKALKDGGVKFDFVGFDACLMATAETALMLDDYADYLIASEETEPGIGWYYTTWLNEYGKNPSMSTLQIGKNIVDGFVSECAVKCAGQGTTLSVIDLAEFAHTVPDALSAFAADTTQMIREQKYTEIATARQSTREFAQSSKIDQCDLVDLARRMDTDASNKLADVLLSAIKYNRTSSKMTNAYGVSIYFPNKKLSSVNSAVSIDNAIGMDSEYSECIKAYASLNMAGQTVSQGMGNTGNPYASLLGSLGSIGGSGASTAGSDLTYQLLSSLLFGGSSQGFFSDRSISDDEIVSFVADNQFDASLLQWQKDANGASYIALPEEQWKYITCLEQNMFYDDGEGYIDLGCDNLFTIDDSGNLYADTDNTWLAVNGQPIAYYHLTTVEDGNDYAITGYTPAMLNGERVVVYLTFDNEEPYGYIAGYAADYRNGETDTIAKADSELQPGDILEFLCDYYSYDGDYLDSYYLGEPMEVTDTMEISNVPVGEGAMVNYKFTDIYSQSYWTPVLQ